jgi:aspartate racemase
MKPVGILGGMGPEATILLMQKVLNAVPAQDDADHIPLIVHQNPQVPSRIAALIDGTGEDPGPTLARMAQDLEKAGAQALAIPCNTAHHYAGVVAAATDLPFLNMIDLTAMDLAKTGAKNIGMLASPATRLAGVFDAVFAAHGLRPIWADDEAGIFTIIKAVKAGQGADQLGDLLTSEAQALMHQGADHLLIACTELSLLTGCIPDELPWADSLDCLTSAIIEFSIG